MKESNAKKNGKKDVLVPAIKQGFKTFEDTGRYSVTSLRIKKKERFALRDRQYKENYIMGPLHPATDKIAMTLEPAKARLFHSEYLDSTCWNWSANFELVSDKQLKEAVSAEKKKSAAKKR